MTNYIKTFSDETAYQQFTESSGYVTPNVSYCSGGSNSLFFNPKHDYSKDYFTLVALEDGQFKFNGGGCGVAPMDSHYYSIDGGKTWTELPANTYTPTITAGNKVLWKNNMPTEYSVGIIESTGSFDVEGNIMSLVYWDDFEGQTSLLGYENLCNGLFDNNTKLNSAVNLSLPATTLADYCYFAMFRGCTSLITAPELPATTLTNDCYSNMFYGCTSLTKAPELPAMTLANECYAYMFFECPSLNSITCLATDISASNCTFYWVYGVPSGGTFTKAASMTSWPRNSNGIPTGWTTVDK